MQTENHEFLGIDVSKGYADFILLNQVKQPIGKPFQLDDNRAGHNFLKNYLDSQLKQTMKISCGVENTGGYEMNWVRAIKSLGKDRKEQLEIFKLNPRGVKHHLQSSLRRTITDSVSATGIAEYVIDNYLAKKQDWDHSTQKEEKETSPQMLLKLIMSYIKQQTVKFNQLEKLLYQAFPELLVFCKDGIPKWVLRLLEKYPGIKDIKNAKVAGIDALPGITMEKAILIKEKATSSVSQSNDPAMSLMLRTLCPDILRLQDQIDSLKEYLVSNYKNSNVALLNSIDGIGDWTASASLIMMGDVNRFTGTDQIAAFFGVHPVFKQSGDGTWGNKMSKQGSAAMRAILFYAANNVILHSEYFKQLYAKHRAKGKKHSSVQGIIMHKLLRVFFGMIKSQTPFNPDMDNKNQNAALEQKATPINKNARRYQPLSMDAPISKSNYKKRKVALECQLSVNDKITASSSATLQGVKTLQGAKV